MNTKYAAWFTVGVFASGLASVILRQRGGRGIATWSEMMAIVLPAALAAALLGGVLWLWLLIRSSMFPDDRRALYFLIPLFLGAACPQVVYWLRVIQAEHGVSLAGPWLIMGVYILATTELNFKRKEA